MKLLVHFKNNWKKITFGLGVLSYGSYYSHNSYKIYKSIRECCKEASNYGDAQGQPKKILLILNPAAKNRKSEKYYKDFCEPILHLAGFMVDILRTESEGHAKTFIESMENLPDGIVVAGGDGTISEIVTGLMRRKNGKCSIAILPIGNENKIARKYFNINPTNHFEYINVLGNATLAIVRGNVQEKDVIELIPADNDSHIQKPIYALGSLEWGAFRDSTSTKEKYWYFGFLKKYASIIFNSYNQNLSWSCKADISYTPCCPGCRNCVKSQENSQRKKFWILPFVTTLSAEKSNLIENKYCNERTSTKIDTSGVYIFAEKDDNVSKLVLCTDPNFKSGWNFLIEGLNKIWRNKDGYTKCIESRSITFVPEIISNYSENLCSIDGEEYDIKPLNICIIPKAIKVFVNVN